MKWLRRILDKSKDTFVTRGRLDTEYLSVVFQGRWEWQKQGPASGAQRPDTPRDPLTAFFFGATSLIGHDENRKRMASIIFRPIESDPLVMGLSDQKRLELLTTKNRKKTNLDEGYIVDRKTSSDEKSLWSEITFRNSFGNWWFIREIVSKRAIISFEYYSTFPTVEDVFLKEKKEILSTLILR